MSQKTIRILIIGIIVAVIIALGIAMLPVVQQRESQPMVNSFEECAAAGYPIMESYPEQCRTPDGRNFVHEIPPQITAFKTPVTLYWPSVAKSATFQDGLIVTLVEIGDSRCKPDVVCIWAGELTGQFHVVGGGVGSQGKKFSLGTERIKSVELGGYTFTLQSATESSVVVMVIKK